MGLVQKSEGGYTPEKYDRIYPLIASMRVPGHHLPGGIRRGLIFYTDRNWVP